MWNKSSQTYSLECWRSWSSSNLWGLAPETDPFCMGRQQALDGNKKGNFPKRSSKTVCKMKEQKCRTNSTRALQSMDKKLQQQIIFRKKCKCELRLFLPFLMMTPRGKTQCFEVRVLSSRCGYEWRPCCEEAHGHQWFFWEFNLSGWGRLQLH